MDVMPLHDAIEPKDLRWLAEHRDPACVSLYLPLEGADPPWVHRTRLQNLVGEAHDELSRRFNADSARDVLDRVQPLLADGALDGRAGEGLAIFADSSGARAYWLPWSVAPRADVGDRFVIKPMVPAQCSRAFHVVTLSQDRVRIFQGDRSGLTELRLSDLPRDGLDDVPGSDAEVTSVQYHSRTRGAQGQGSAPIFHGHRDATKAEQELLARLCRETVASLRKVLPQRHAPVMVAAVQRLAATFAEHASGIDIVAVIEGNPDEMTPGELHAMCLPRLDQHVGEQLEERAEELGDAIHGGLGSTDLQDIVVAAHDGRIATLFVDRGLERWGRLDPARRRVSMHDERRPGDDDLVDLAMAQTLAHRGSVVPNVPEGVEADVPIAAIYRHA